MGMIIEKKVHLTIPKDQLNQPLIYKLIRYFDLETNILEAHISEESGWLIMLVQGDPDWLQKGMEWVVEQGVTIEVMDERTVEG
jgi:L-aspartate semialdehyde sulfurtransferase ferredoxin